jgi:hypothetical protein
LTVARAESISSLRLPEDPPACIAAKHRWPRTLSDRERVAEDCVRLTNKFLERHDIDQSRVMDVVDAALEALFVQKGS